MKSSLHMLLAVGCSALNMLPDGRRVHILKSDEAVADLIRVRVSEQIKEAIASKGAFSMSIGSGTTVSPLIDLGSVASIDYTKVHLFFGNERTEGDAAGKCLRGAAELLRAWEGVVVHPVPSGPAADSACQYETELRAMPDNIVGVCSRSGLPALDLCLLGSGADGHCASLYPDSEQVVRYAGSNERVYVPADGKGGITLTIDAINSARQVLLSAGKPTQADMVRKALGWSNAASNTAIPAAMVAASDDTNVEWLLTQESAVALPAL